MTWLLVISCAAMNLQISGTVRVWRGIALSGLVVLMVSPQRLLPRDHGVEKNWSWLQHLLGNGYLIWSLAVLVGLWATTGVRRPTEPPG